MTRPAICFTTSFCLLCSLIFVSNRPVCASDVIPGAPQTKPVALVGGIVHTVSGKTLPKGTVVFEQGRITAVGNVKPPAGADVVELKGQHVFPGLIDAYSQMGLVEIGAVRATRDYRESGELNPNVKAWVAVNPDSELIPVARSNGVLLTVTAPSGGVISGQAALLQLDGWTTEDLAVKRNIGVIVARPNYPKLRAFFDEARAYHKAIDNPESGQRHDARLAALGPVLAGQRPLIVAADLIQEIQAAVAFASLQNVKLIILGGYDAVDVADLLKQNNVPVIVQAVHRNPQRRDDAYDSAYTLPERLRRAGVRWCLSGEGSASNARNLPYHAGTAVAFGLAPEEALKAVTLYPAQILGMSDRLGSLQPGRDATLFIANGDILETATQVSAAWVQGRKLDLRDRHKQLYLKYRTRYERLNK